MTYNTNDKIPSLSEVRRKEREERKEKFNKSAKELLLKAISYYNIHYPNSTHNNVWNNSKIKIEIGNDTLEEELYLLNEKELHSIYDILTYFHDERQISKIEDHNSKDRILSMIRKIIPGGIYLDKLYELYNKQSIINKEIKKIEDDLDKERNEFIERLEKNESRITGDYPCKLCEKVCKSAAGLKSHMRVHSEDD